MKPSLIVYGVPNGKTRFAERIAEFYGLNDGGKFSVYRMLMAENMVYFYYGNQDSIPFFIQMKSFDEVAKEINAGISKTPWFDKFILPEYDGVYECDTGRNHIGYRNFKNGLWRLGSDYKDCAALMITESHLGLLPWRGLSQEPINTKE